MKMLYKSTLFFVVFMFLGIVVYAAQETKNSGYKPKESQQSNTESTTILIFKAPVQSNNENGNVRKAGRAERTTVVPHINRLKADTRKNLLISMSA